MGKSIALRDRVYELMAQLPDDKVTTYGDLAAFAGHPYAARRVGEIAHGVLCLDLVRAGFAAVGRTPMAQGRRKARYPDTTTGPGRFLEMGGR